MSSEHCTAYGSSVNGAIWDFSFYTTVASVAFVWWIVPVVMNLGKPKQILRAICWSAVRVSMPGAAGLLAIKSSKTLKESITIYYDGLPVHTGNPPETEDSPYTFKKVAKILFNLFMDIAFSLVPAMNLLATRRECLSEDGIWKILGPSLWFYPNVPTALFGVWIISNAWFFRLGRGWSLVCCYGIIVVVGMALFLSAFLNTKLGTTSLSVLAYATMSVPFALWGNPIRLLWIILSALYGVVARNLTISLAALWQEEPWKSSLRCPLGSGIILLLPSICSSWDAFALGLAFGAYT